MGSESIESLSLGIRERKVCFGQRMEMRWGTGAEDRNGSGRYNWCVCLVVSV